ncbi:DUF1765-domain-containing protein [Periconia macrospinosa]|uniref:DUF1765-domain-containing protein n=1 Tax=Periconia macrospinosa TaxID=97972 RepID=A0A2V1E795_9PLEO|nr:DUF1765-domain-containing protein [Periconia macrospinosa]
MQAVASAIRGHDVFHAPRGRNRAVSEIVPPTQERKPEPPPLPKAASYTYFPRVKDIEDTQVVGVKGTISEEELKTDVSADASYASSDGSSHDSDESAKPVEMPQLRENPRRSSTFNLFSSKSRDSSNEPKTERNRTENLKQATSSESRSPVRSLTRLRRKSWISPSSRSSSPTKDAQASKKEEPPRNPSQNRKSIGGPLSIPEKAKTKDEITSPTMQKRGVLAKRANRLSGIFNSTHLEQTASPASQTPAVPPLPKSFSTDKLPSYVQTPPSTSHVPPIPRDISSDKLKGLKTEPRKKDELWTVFRTLEGDLRKFQSKSSAFKANAVRTTLLPFLRSYTNHASSLKLRPEDLDRRCNILNGWWTGLLELLSGRNNQSISGTDRPAILEGITGIMERPEWRSSPSPFCALVDRTETNSTNSNSSSSSDFLAESVYHNVRNIFTQNLISQMAYVVDKMSLRNAAASLVTFGGKTCAYAFCFCPGVADVLVRLWNLPSDTMKRVLAEAGITRAKGPDLVSENIASAFPPLLSSLKFQPLAKTVRLLRRPATLPLGTANVDWYGPWIKRWSGAESDLFYVFVKHFHILATEFLPQEPSKVERICVPGLLMVHAQILVNLDATIHRHAAPHVVEDGPSSVTFDDVLGDPDASASTIPIPPANATRQMAENRLIMLIRDFLSDRNSHIAPARRVFAESFACLLKAAAGRVSIYENNSCYTLCDFLEEALVIMVRYEQLHEQREDVLDWPFWLSVCKQMAASENTATEIKLYSFLYSSWSIISTNEQRKESLCVDFLLEPEFFESRFNHWCPMVRSYFMRLLCWRIARFDGQESDAQLNILQAVSDRLRSVWSHYMWLREEAEEKGILPPSTQACNPAPARRFLIIRNDNPIVTNTQPFLSFDGVVQSPAPRRLSATTTQERPVSTASTESLDFPEENATKGRWSILKSFMPGSQKQTKSKATESGSTNKENTKTSGTSPRKDNGVDGSTAKPSASETPVPTFTHKSYSFRFSLEWVDKRFGTYQNMRLSPPRLPLPAQVLLQMKGINTEPVVSSQPIGSAARSSRYAGRALAEWTFISHECQNFFDRRKNEGVPSNKQVETPTLAVEAFRRPG